MCQGTALKLKTAKPLSLQVLIFLIGCFLFIVAKGESFQKAELKNKQSSFVVGVVPNYSSRFDRNMADETFNQIFHLKEVGLRTGKNGMVANKFETF